MTRTWKFTDLEFVVAWKSVQADFLPAPFVFTSRTPLYDDYQREQREIRAQVRPTLEAGFDRVLDVVAQPDIRIELHGWGKDHEDAESQIRLLAVRRDGDGYLLKQLPGETAWHSGGYVVTECPPRELADALIAEIPELEAGTEGDVVLARGSDRVEVDYAYGRSKVHDSLADTVEQQTNRFLRATTAGQGRIKVAQGVSRFGPRGVVAIPLHWRDVEDDGRYAITPGPPPVAVPASKLRFIGLVNDSVAEVISAIRDDRR
ncbi:ESX secretion-associated protein EspG [Nocardia sp. NPDC019395]|uniref:ESX secretion-associated protein EspG n=1 Tax=Nocardia sp. NPDC019395 TaxID=3154686 RepID=UPI0033C9E4E9